MYGFAFFFALFVIVYQTNGEFLCIRHFEDGIKEIHLSWRRILAMQTTEESMEGYKLWQVTDNRNFMQLIYTADMEIRDCEYLNDQVSIRNFTKKFISDYECSRSLRDAKAVRKCGDIYCVRINRLPNDFLNFTNYEILQEQCRRHHIKILSSFGNRRSRRDLFLYPGTNWCGSGSSVRRFNQLGYNAASDRCCRDHDLCPYTISAFSSKYNLFNYRFHTLSHCDCDERFRACLKLNGSPTSNMIGRLYFNIVQTKCFVFRMETVCAKWSWWGKCVQQQSQTRASLKDPLNY